MYKIEFSSTPLQENSIVEFTIGERKYYGRVDRDSTDNSEWFLFTKNPRIVSQEDFVSAVFAPLGVTAKEYYTRVLGTPGFGGVWPQTSFKSLVDILVHMVQDYDKLNKPSIDSSKFRFKIGDTILYDDKFHDVVGYYFDGDFNDFSHEYGYVIEGDEGHIDGSFFGYDQYGKHLPHSTSKDKCYIHEWEAKPSSIKKNPTLDFSKFRFRAGDTVSFMGEPCVIVGYYFASSHFNDFDHLYGYVVAGHSLGHHNGSKWGFDQWGNHLPDDDSEDKYYLCENDVSVAGSIKKQLTLNNKQLKTKGYEIKLQRTKSSIRRGEVPEGSRVRSKVHKTSISIQHLSYTEIVS